MRKQVVGLSFLLAITLIAVGCTKKPADAANAEVPGQSLTASPGSPDSVAKPDASSGMTGTVLPPGLGSKANDDSASSQPSAPSADTASAPKKVSKKIAHSGRRHRRSHHRRAHRHHRRHRHHHKKS
jgi:hypothetical protein